MVSPGSFRITLGTDTLHITVREESFTFWTVKLFNGLGINVIFFIKL
jgi:hypothetical protein